MKLFLAFLLIFNFLCIKANADSARTVRVRIIKNSHSLSITGKSLRWHFEKVKRISFVKEQGVTISRENNSWILKKNKYKEKKSSPFLVLEGRDIKIGSQSVASKLLFIADRDDSQKMQVIAYEDLEMYVAGVMSQEMPSSWSAEALKAQSVVARSYVYFKMQQSKNKLFDVESTILDQVYKSLTSQNELVSQKLLSIISQTRGVVLKDSKGKALKTFYHADCGGGTSTAQSVFREKTETAFVSDKSCPLNPKGHWKVAIPLTELAERLKVPFGIHQISSFKDQSGRVVQFTLSSQSGEKISLLGEKLRRVFGYDVIKSLNLRHEIKNNQLEMAGKGFGHGVGLCQWGSEHLGKNGKSYQQILLHYFPQAKVDNLNPTWL